MRNYKLYRQIGRGTFSDVVHGQSLLTGRHVAVKMMKRRYKTKEDVSDIQEVQTLVRLSGNPHIIKLEDVVYDEVTGKLALVFEMMSCSLYDVLKDRKTKYPSDLVDHWMFQLLSGLAFIHSNGIIHRDVSC